MSIHSIPDAWKRNIRTGAIADRDLRLYCDFRQFEYPDLGTGNAQYTVGGEENLIRRGNCELGIAPMVAGETVPSLSNATWARSTDFAHTGNASYKFTKTNAAGTAANASLVNNTTDTDMHGVVAGTSIELSEWVYIPTASGIDPSEVTLIVNEALVGAGFGVRTSAAATLLDTWEELSVSITLDSTAGGFTARIVVASTASQNEYFYVDDVKLSTHNIPGSHYLSGGYIETLRTLPDKFTLQVRFLPKFAFDAAGNKLLFYWSSGSLFFQFYYLGTADTFIVTWYDGGVARALQSAQYDNGTAHRNLNKWTTTTIAIDLTTGSTAGSSLWMDKTQDDTIWDGNIDAKTSVFNKMIVAANGEYDIAHVLMIPDIVATNAQTQNDFKDIKAEQIIWSLDGHGTGRTRVNINTPGNAQNPLLHYDLYKGITSQNNATFGTNTFNFRLQNNSGAFSDDQNAAWEPGASVYNGTNAQNYLQQRFGVIAESWFNGDFDYVFSGRATEDGFQRQSKMKSFSTVDCSSEDGVGDLDRSFEEFGRVFPGNMLTRQTTILDRGSCESTTPPSMIGEITNTLSNATFARDTTQVYHGRYAYLGTKTIAAGTAATITLADSVAGGDLHGFVAGATYTWICKLWLDSGAMLGSEWVLAIVDSVGSTTQAAANTYDQWQVVKVERTVNAGATFAYPQIQLASAAAINEIFYFDDTEMQPANASEATDNSLFHLIAKRGYRRQIQFLSNNSFENATITDSWLASGGTWTKDATDKLFGSASGKLVLGGSTEFVMQLLLFTGTKTLNVGETYNFSIWLKSTAAASGADNTILLQEGDVDAVNVTTTVAYSLAGGEDYVKIEASHTITDSDSDRLRVIVSAAAGDTINMDGAMLIQSDRALEYFEENTLDGGEGVSFADLGDEISWPWFGIITGNVDYIHPWRRMELNTTTWVNLKSVGAGTGARYCGMDENNTLINHSILDNDFGDSVPSGIVTGNFADTNHALHDGVLVTLDQFNANRLYGVGPKFEISTIQRLIWSASATGNFTDVDGDQQLEESVLNGAFWPKQSDYNEYWAQYGTVENFQSYGWVGVAFPYTPTTGTGSTPSHPPSDGTFGILSYQTGPTLINRDVPTSKRDRIVGIQGAVLIHKTILTGEGDGPMAYVTAGRLVSGLDILSRAGQAQILLLNNTGVTQTLVDAAIVATPVYKFTGSEGFIHDSYIDRDDIAKNGERLVQFGGEDVIDGETGGQLDRLADFIWKDRATRKHLHVIASTGTLHDIGPAMWMHIDIGAAGETENILGTDEAIGIRISADADRRGMTQITYRELTEAWKYDSNAFARFVARGVPANKQSAGVEITVGSEFYMGSGDYRIPIGNTSAQTRINEAIDFLSGTYDGGTVRLTRGTYNTDGAILLKANVVLRGEGTQTIIKPSSGNHDAIAVEGALFSEIENVEIRDLRIERDTAVTNFYGLDLDYANFIVVDNVSIIGEWQAINDIQCRSATYSKINIIGFVLAGMSCSGAFSNISDILIDGESTLQPTVGGFGLGSGSEVTNVTVKNINSSITGSDVNCFLIHTNARRSAITNINIDNCSMASATHAIHGIDIDVIQTMLENIIITDIDNDDTAANAVGCYVDGVSNSISNLMVADGTGTGIQVTSDGDFAVLSGGSISNNDTKGIVIDSGAVDVVIDSYVSRDNGADTGIDNTNGDNFSDAGTNTFLG